MSAHARVSPSSMHRRLACPGSLRMEEQYPDEVNEYAAWGTCSHQIAENCLTLQMEPHDWEGQTVKADGFEFPVDDEMIDCATFYVDTVHERVMLNPKAESNTEARLKINDDCWGTADHKLQDVGYVEITDLKTGFVVVEPTAVQLKTYGVGALREDTVHVCTRIVQPRAIHPEGPVREKWWKADELRQWRDDVLLPGIALALTEDAPLAAGDHCKYCRAQAGCPVFQAASKLQEQTLADMTDEELVAELGRLELYKERQKAVDKEAQKRLRDGAELGGWYLGETSKHFTWLAPAEAAARQEWGDDAFTNALKSAAQIAKLPGGVDFKKKYAFKPPGDTKLCPPGSPAPKKSVRNAEAAFASHIRKP